ncbi:MAG: hypothetical protein ACRD3T_19665 [Terriglobia bacterium]
MEKKWVRARIPEDAQEFLCIATFLPLRRWRDVVPFLRLSFQVEKQLQKSSGMVRYGLKTDVPRKHFWTLSVWEDRASVNAFVAAQPHAAAVKKFERWAGEGAAFVEWKASSSDPAWAAVFDKLKNPTFYYKASGR